MEPITEPYVFNPITEKRRPVKNLGWLLRHNSEVLYFNVRTRITLPEGLLPAHVACLLSATLRTSEGKYLLYVTPFADAGVLRQWSSRPSFIGLRCSWNDIPQTISKGW